MKALSLMQPWATLVAIGAKRIETRSWSTRYRGPVAIHAAKGFPCAAVLACHEEPFRSALLLSGVRSWTSVYPGGLPMPVHGALPRGAIVAVAELVDCLRFSDETAVKVARGFGEQEAAFGDFDWGRFGLLLVNVRRLAEPIPCRGAQGLWEVPAEIAARLAV